MRVRTGCNPIEARAVTEGALLTLNDVAAEDMPTLKAGTPPGIVASTLILKKIYMGAPNFTLIFVMPRTPVAVQQVFVLKPAHARI